MDIYLFIKFIHIISSTILFGTGLGVAFFMMRSCFTNHLQEKFYAIRTTVLADYLFTVPAVIVQPLSGFWLVWKGGYDMNALWLMMTYGLYAIAGACWLPVVWIQIRLKDMLAQSLEQDMPLPENYRQLFRMWFVLGWPAFTSLIIIFLLMVMKPV